MNFLITLVAAALLGVVLAGTFSNGNLRKSMLTTQGKSANHTVTRISLFDYSNPSDLLADGTQCDHGSWFGFHKCDPFFLVTYTGGNTSLTVKYNESKWEDVSYIVFNANLTVNLTTLAGAPITVQIVVWDEDVLSHDIIGHFNFTHIATPNTNVSQIAVSGKTFMRVRFETFQNVTDYKRLE